MSSFPYPKVEDLFSGAKMPEEFCNLFQAALASEQRNRVVPAAQYYTNLVNKYADNNTMQGLLRQIPMALRNNLANVQLGLENQLYPEGVFANSYQSLAEFYTRKQKVIALPDGTTTHELIVDYIMAFKHILTKVPPVAHPPEEQQIATIIDGLKEPWRSHMATKERPATLALLQQELLRLESANRKTNANLMVVPAHYYGQPVAAVNTTTSRPASPAWVKMSTLASEKRELTDQIKGVTSSVNLIQKQIDRMHEQLTKHQEVAVNQVATSASQQPYGGRFANNPLVKYSDTMAHNYSSGEQPQYGHYGNASSYTRRCNNCRDLDHDSDQCLARCKFCKDPEHNYNHCPNPNNNRNKGIVQQVTKRLMADHRAAQRKAEEDEIISKKSKKALKTKKDT